MKANNKLAGVDWSAIQTAFAAGIGLRELARRTGVPSGTIRSRASREKWGAKIKDAKQMGTMQPVAAMVLPASAASTAGSQPLCLTAEAVPHFIAELRRDYELKMVKKAIEMGSYLEHLEPAQFLSSSADVERVDKIARRTLGMDEIESRRPLLINLAVLEKTELRRVNR